jgi:hypothetical protein
MTELKRLQNEIANSEKIQQKANGAERRPLENLEDMPVT